MSSESSSGLPADSVADLLGEETDDHAPVGAPCVDGLSRQREETCSQGVPPRSQEADLTQLRRLLLGKDYERLPVMRDDMERMLGLEAALKDPVRQIDQVARVLSEAMLLRENRDRGISKALRPALSDAIKAVVRKNPQPVVEAVSPVIGPAIRRSVNDAIAGMLELFDKLLEHNLSLQALKWRIEAWRAGRRYSEVVLLRTLIYQVDQVLLIHRETGLLLQHVESLQSGARDPDLVGGMLTAINDFVSDSFSATEESRVQAMQVGDFKVIVEQGRLAVIAAIARGNPPTELAQTIRETLETVEVLYGDLLERFDGDSTPFSETNPLLADCLKSQRRPAATRRPLWLVPLLIGLVLLTVLGYWGWSSYRANSLWSTALSALRSEPGIAITDTTRDGDVYRVHGLHDPLARDPEAVIGPEALSALQWEWDWRPYLSTEPKLLLVRARQLLRPPPTVELFFDGDILVLSGEASQSWIDTMRTEAPRIPGISGYRDGALKAIADQTAELWSAALKALRGEPGIVLVEALRDGRNARVHGLRDPLAREPEAIIGSEAASKLHWEWHWRPFVSAEQEFLLIRARQDLQPPDTGSLFLDGSVLQLTGEAPQQWVDTLDLAVRGIPGITGYLDDNLSAIDGMAGHREALARYRNEIEGTTLYFDVNAVQLEADQLSRLEALAEAMKALVPVAGELDLRPAYLVTGHVDATGSRSQNRRLRFSRASNVIEELVARGVGEYLFLPLKMGVRTPGEPGKTQEQRARNRRVTVDVKLLRDGSGTAAR